MLTNSSIELSKKIKQYITEGKYDIQVGEKDQYKYYRFNNPKIENFAKEIELFASNENELELDEGQRILPIDPEEGLYSLSAIMLDPEYFEMIKSNINKSGEAPCTNTQATIMLKMSAFYDLRSREDRKWRKHRRDILKLSLLLTGEEEIKLTGRMKEDFNSFIQHLEEELDQKSIKSFVDGLPIYKDQVIEVLERVFSE